MRILIVLLLIFTGWSASAEVYLKVNERLKAYSNPRISSKVLRKLQRGEEFLHTGRTGRGFIEILDEEGETLYVRRKDMLNSKLVKKKPAGPHGSHHFGFDFYFSNQSQGERELQTGTDTIYDVSEFSGSTFFFGGYYSLPLSKIWTGRISLKMRQTKMEGEATLQGSMSGNKSVFELTQNFISLGGAISRSFIYPNMYMIGEVEFAKGTDVELVVTSGTPVNTSDVETPFFVIFTGGLGYHYEVSKKLLFSPEFRLGAVSTADPFILLMELRAGLGYRF